MGDERPRRCCAVSNPLATPDLLHVLAGAGDGDRVGRVAAGAVVIVRTGERRPYCNVLLTKGVICS